MIDEFAKWHIAAVRCPECLDRSTWCAPAEEDEAMEYICLACNGQFYRKGRSFMDYTPHRQLSEWDQDRVRQLRIKAGCGSNSAVGAFG